MTMAALVLCGALMVPATGGALLVRLRDRGSPWGTPPALAVGTVLLLTYCLVLMLTGAAIAADHRP